MASQKSAQYPYQWPNGSWHSIPWDRHVQNMAFQNPNSPNLAQIAAGAPVGQAVGLGQSTDPATMPQPFDPALAAQTQQATWNRGLSDAEAAYQTGETAYALGYNADGSLNTANPYSQAQLLQNEYKRSVTGANTSMAAQGQLYSGARLNAQARNDRVYAEGSSALRDRARQTYHGIGFGQLQSYGANSIGLGQDQWDSLRRSVYGG